MKDVRDKYSGVTDEEFDSEFDLRRAGRARKLPASDEEESNGEIDELASSIYEFLYASDSNMDIDSIL